ILDAIARVQIAMAAHNFDLIDPALRDIADAVRQQAAVLQRIPEQMDPALYYRTFRPYIRFFENVSYQGVAQDPGGHSVRSGPAAVSMNFRGETGAQSSIMP